MNSQAIRPFLKWAGGKSKLIPYLQPLLPQASVYIEPFVGAGAIFLNTPYTKTLLNDINSDLISLYRFLQEEGPSFIRYTNRWFKPHYNTPEQYYALREKFNQGKHPRQRAALFLYLNRHGYNGLCRYNQKGGFNAPYGHYKKPYFPKTELLSFHQRLQTATLCNQDYRGIIQKAPANSLIYCDPPYVPLSRTARFTQYSATHFSLQHQEELAELAKIAAQKGSHVFISNHDLPFTRKLYESATLFSVQMARNISCHGHSRLPVKELLAYYSPPTITSP